VACFAASFTHAAEPGTGPVKRLLLISTGSRLAPGFIIVDQQILAALNRTPAPKVEIYAENLDTVRFPAERSQRIFAEYLAEKYADYPPDLIMLLFVGSVAPPGKILSELFPATPVIVAGLTEEVLREDEFGSSVGGFAQRTDPEATLRVILRLQPSLERLVIVAGTAEIDRQLLRRVESAAHGLKGKLDIQIWNNVRVSELRERATHLPPRSAILFTRMFQDGAGQATISAQVGRWLSEWANAPVYVLSDGAFGTGAVGGSVASIEAFGQRAGELARRTLTGAAEEALRFEVLTATVPMFDWRALKRWSIDESRLPPGSIVRFRPESIWEQYRWYITAALLIIVMQSATIVALAVQRSRLRRMQDALTHNQQLMALATEAGGLGLWSRDIKSGDFWANASMRRLFDLGPQEPAHFEDALARVHWSDRARAIGEMERAQAKGIPFQTEFCISLPDGTERWVLARGRTVPTSSGHTRRMGVVLDLTERRQAEEKLRESEDRFRTMANAAPAMIWMSGTDKLCTFFNEAWLDFTGRTLDQELGDGWTRDVHADDLERCLAVYGAAFDNRAQFRMEYRLRRWDGEYRYILDHGAPRFQPDGIFLGYIGSCMDVTERKAAEESLRKERAFLRQVIDVNPNFIFAKDREGRFTLANKAVADVYGVTVNGLIGRTDADFNRNPEEIRFFRNVDLEVMDTLQERFIPEERITDTRGRVRWLQTVKRPLIGVDGRANDVLGASTDITLRRQTEIQLQEQRAALTHVARVAIMGELTASLAHELNQPLAAILSNARAALRFMEYEPINLQEVREALNDIVSADHRAAEIIRQTRALVKKEENGREFGAVDVGSVVREVVALVRGDAILQDIRIFVEVEDDLPAVRGGAIQLQQVVLNILLNAFDAMKNTPAEARKVQVRAAADEGAMARVSICDCGPGLSSEDLGRIFQPFYTTKRDGLGMGLSICRTIIEAHRGRLWAENNPDHGTTFHFTVPAYSE
jgi:PAS domain S-box-containing protein